MNNLKEKLDSLVSPAVQQMILSDVKSVAWRSLQGFAVAELAVFSNYLPQLTSNQLALALLTLVVSELMKDLNKGLPTNTA